MTALPIFNQIYQKSILLADTFELHKYKSLAYINVPNARTR